MDFNTFRSRFSESDRSITLEQYRALNLDELNGLIRDANLSRPDTGQARLFHPSSQQGKTKHHLFTFKFSPCFLSFSVCCRSADSSGHVSVSGGITPHINERTISLRSAGDLTLFTFDGKDSLYYLKLWAKLLKRKKSNYKVVIDTAARKVCFHQKAYSPAILWFPMTDVREVRNWYINFRLCGDSFPVFFKHKGTNSLEVESVATPPPELNCLPKYM